ncbi:chemotaxis protein CheB [Gilvimarinus algae]|uniref:protein-glutamate methylesterase n=1 Tax=Gilvimarinus algae TaxID=3058037 RepID=A0ABT8TI73_9GAMM|nr:chemotaxis protein CheB [Gilvimarinus sp. SDUM040014]MDO3383184.1 chemotaxis protein CheB [Gilvimarinus sp. SDUM040014]
MAAPLRLGVLVDSEAKLTLLKTAVSQVGQRIDYCALVPGPDASETMSVLSLDELEQVSDLDAWLVDITHAEDDTRLSPGAAILSALLSAPSPVLLSDSSELGSGPAERMAWVARLKSRLQRLIGEVNLQSQKAANSVWVLAASTGGPSAVSDFLRALAPDLGVGFLYVQHINEGYSPALMNMISKAGHYPAGTAKQGSVIGANTVTIVDPVKRVEIQENSTLVLHDEPWGGCYQPSIDQLVANLARTHRQRSGLIVFSGMGNDGSASCRFIRQQRGQVWVQDPDSCVLDSMPAATLQTGCVDRIGTPADLAQSLEIFLRQSNFDEEPQAHESSATH